MSAHFVDDDDDATFLAALSRKLDVERDRAAAVHAAAQHDVARAHALLIQHDESEPEDVRQPEVAAMERAEVAAAEAARALADLDARSHTVRARLADVHLRQNRDALAKLQGDLTVARVTVSVAYPMLGAGLEDAVQRAGRWLDIAEVFVAPRIAQEELGDARENIARFAREGRPRWQILTHALVCAVLAVWHTWGDKIAALRRSQG